MKRFWSSPAGRNWRAAALLGLVTSTFSTLVSQFTAARVGRDAVVDWMVVASIPLRDPALQIEPSWSVILAGILFHQWADFSWAMVFFGLLGRWTANLRPWTILLLGAPWAVFTSALEWLFLVHATSASLYPLFPWLRDWVAGQRPRSHPHFTAVWSGLAVAGLIGLGTLAFFGWQGRELPWLGRDAAYDQGYMRRMMAHHAQGIAVARLGAERAGDPHLRALARLMVATQQGENAVFAQWWQSWFGLPLEACSPEEEAGMPGMLRPDEMESLRQAQGPAFDPLFIKLLTHHHTGAIRMADEALRRAGDPRLVLMSHAIRHEQRGEIELMRGSQGLSAVRAAVSNLLLPDDERSAEEVGRGGPP